MDEFDFEELIADMLGVSDEHMEDSGFIDNLFYENFDMSTEQGYKLAKALLLHTPKVQAGLSGKTYHAFVSKTKPIMLMKIEAAGA